MPCNFAPKERLQQFAKTTNLTDQEFEKRCGMANATLSRLNAPTTTTLERVKTAFPRLDLNWLITGEGEMLLPIREKQSDAKVAVNGNSNKLSNVGNEAKDCDNAEMMQTLIDTLTRQIEEKDKQINSLLKILEK